MAEALGAGVRWRARAREWWSARPRVVRLHHMGFALCVLSMLLATIRLPSAVVLVPFLLGIAASSFAVLQECYVFFIRVAGSPIVKTLVAAAVVMAVAVATGLSGAIVNSATGQDPTNFKLTVALLTPIAFVPLLAMLTVIVGLFAIPLFMVLSIGGPLVRGDRVDDTKLVGRLVGTIGIISVCSVSLSPNSAFDRFGTSVAQRGAILLDMHADAACTLNKNDRVLRLNDTLVVLGRQVGDQIIFKRVRCPLDAEANIP